MRTIDHLMCQNKERTMSRIRNAARRNLPTLAKTGSYYVIHICVAAMVAYAVTGN
jgi:transcriptional/translational regulatory protein YebC/TACO1